MTDEKFSEQLRRLVSAADLESDAAALTAEWTATGAGPETIEPILRFMEANPEIDLGTPGALVHYLERFWRHGCEERLLESVERKPTTHTVWMLNRLINGTKQGDMRRRFILAMERLRANPSADRLTVEQANHYLTRLSRG